jgi:HSP20 family protein
MPDRPDPFSEIEQLFEQFSQLGDPLGGRIPVDVIDTTDELLVRADLPGRSPDAVSVQLEDDRTVLIETEPEESDPGGRFVTRERTNEAMSRTVALPAAVDGSGTEASYERGVLTVRLPKLSGDTGGTDIPVN